MVYQNDDFLLKHALVSNESFMPASSLEAATCSIQPLASCHSSQVLIASKRTRELGLVTFGLVMFGSRSPSLYRAKYIIVALLKIVLLER